MTTFFANTFIVRHFSTAYHNWILGMLLYFLTGLGSAGVGPTFQNHRGQSRRLWKSQRERFVQFSRFALVVCCEPPGAQQAAVGKHQHGGRGHVQTQRPAASTGWVAESPAEGERVGSSTARSLVCDDWEWRSGHCHLDTGDGSVLLLISVLFWRTTNFKFFRNTLDYLKTFKLKTSTKWPRHVD